MNLPVYQRHKKVIIIGGGESLIGFDFSQLDDFDGAIITVNSVIYHIPRADYWITCDLSSLQKGLQTLKKGCYYYAGYPFFPKGYYMKTDVHYLDKVMDESYRLQEDKCKITGLVDSTYGALNLAYHFEAEEIVMLGIDYYGFGHWYDTKSPYNAKGVKNWKEHTIERWLHIYEKSVKQFEKRGTKVINGSKNSAIKCFNRMTPQDAVNCIL